MKVRYPHPVTGKWYPRLSHLSLLCLLVSVVSHDEAEEEPRHHDVPQAQHGEVAGGAGGGEDKLAWQGEIGGIAGHSASYTSCHNITLYSRTITTYCTALHLGTLQTSLHCNTVHWFITLRHTLLYITHCYGHLYINYYILHYGITNPLLLYQVTHLAITS